jgi:hypothetical protein
MALLGDASMRNQSKETGLLASVRRAFWTIVWPRRKLVLIGLVLVGVNRLSGPGPSRLDKYLIDNVIAGYLPGC